MDMNSLSALVSIITPVYNASRFIKDTAKSVFNQSYSNWEWILVDDCSKDNSWLILSELAKNDNRVKIYSNKINLKSGKTRNLAIKKAKGRFVSFS